MKIRPFKYAALILVLLMALLLGAGCSMSGLEGTKTKDGDKVLFSYDDTEVTLKEAWIYTKMVAAQTEAMYAQYYGQDNISSIWSMTVDQDGNTMEDMTKENAVSQIRKVIVLVNRAGEYDCALSDEDKKECEKYADAFAKDQNGKVIMEECGADKDDVLKIYEDNMLAHKVQEAMVKDVDTKVSDDEARVTRVKRVIFETVTYDQETGEEKKLNDKQKNKLKKRAQKALDKIKKGETTIDNVAKENAGAEGAENPDLEETFSKGESEEGKKFEKAIGKLKDGDVLDQVIETDHGYVIAQLVAKTDKEATKENKKSIIEQRKQDAFNDKYNEWTKELEKDWDYKKEVDQELFAQLKLGETPDEATTELIPETAPEEATSQVPEAEGTSTAAEEAATSAEK